MKRRPALLLLTLAALFFLSWIGWLAYLALKTHNTLILSQPQFLVSDLVVSGQMDALDQAVTVEEVFYPQEAAWRTGSAIQVVNLKECQACVEPGRPLLPIEPGRYLMPLSSALDGKVFRVAAIPPSPGYPGDTPRIYPHTPSTEAQLKQILSQLHK